MNFGLVAETLKEELYFKFLNELVDSGEYNAVAMVNRPQVFPINPEFAFLPQKEVFIFDGPLMAVDFPSAKLILNRFRDCQNFYYLAGIDWYKVDHLSYNNISKIFLSGDLELLVNTTEEATIVKNVWGRPATVIGELEIESVRRIIG